MILKKGGRTLSGIDCRQAETLVARYIKHTLSTDELEEFLDHIEHCSSCYDELETYFIVHEAIQQLDEKEDGTVLDFRELLEQDIRRSRRYIRQKRWLHFLSVIFFYGSSDRGCIICCISCNGSNALFIT